ncbi:MAG: hypothetical protein QOI13_2660 [Paraburkholderia sp.]|jgi:hypothetical protein|nr:hypothetical protein [Paraburkholderia sp.]
MSAARLILAAVARRPPIATALRRFRDNQSDADRLFGNRLIQKLEALRGAPLPRADQTFANASRA